MNKKVKRISEARKAYLVQPKGETKMQTYSITGKIGSDGHLRLDIPTQLPEGEVSILVVVGNVATYHPITPTQQNSYPLRGKVIHYNGPTESVAEDEWDALK